MPTLHTYPPGSLEPVTLAEAKDACRVDISELDADIGVSIAAAREAAEQITSRWYRRQVQRALLADWPAESFVVLPLYAPQAVVVEYRSAADPEAWTQWPADQYRWSGFGFETRIDRRRAVPAWPALADALEWPERVRIDVTVGPLDASTVPASVRRYILATVAAWLEQPAAQRAGSGGLSANPLFERLLDREKLWA
jgi:uncharacterized phiE125 gp8 family phage protein